MHHITRVRLLYKTILKLHRGLPAPAKELGDQYVRDEFRRHKSVEKDVANLFVKEWTDYTITLAKQLGLKGVKFQKPLGKHLQDNQLEHFSEEQISQLYELLKSITLSDPFKDKSNKNA